MQELLEANARLEQLEGVEAFPGLSKAMARRILLMAVSHSNDLADIAKYLENAGWLAASASAWFDPQLKATFVSNGALDVQRRRDLEEIERILKGV